MNSEVHQANGSRSAYFYAFLAIAGWSTSATFGGLLSGYSSSAQIVFSIQLIASVTLIIFFKKWFSLENIGGFLAVLGSNRRVLVSFTIFSIFLLMYQVFFYYALLGISRIYANLANYLWPILLYFLLLTPIVKRREKFRLIDLLLLLLAFFGVASLAFGADVFPEGEERQLAYLGLASGLLAAGCAAIYMAASSVVLRECNRVDFCMASPHLYVLAMTPTCTLLGIFLYFQGDFPSLDLRTTLIFLWLGVVTVGIAQTSWTHALSVGNAGQIPVLAYLVPVISTGLQIVVFGDELTPTLIFGIVFIIAASVLTAKIFGQILAETAAVIAFMYVGFAAYFEIGVFLDIGFQSIDVFSLQIFGLLTAFALNRQSQTMFSQKEKLFSWRAKLAVLLREADVFLDDGKVSDDNRNLLKERVYSALRAIVEIDQSATEAGRAAKYSEYLSAESRLIKAANSISDTDLPSLKKACDELQDTSAEILSIPMERIGRGEIIIICILGLSACVFYSAGSLDTAARAVLSMSVVAAITFLVFRVIKQNVQPALHSVSDLENLQNLKILASQPIYVGDISKLVLGSDIAKLEREILLVNEDGSYQTTHTSEKVNSVTELASKRRLGLAFMLLGALAITILIVVTK